MIRLFTLFIGAILMTPSAHAQDKPAPNDKGWSLTIHAAQA